MNNQIFDNWLLMLSLLAFAFVFVLFAKGFNSFGKANKVFTFYLLLLNCIVFSEIFCLKNKFYLFPTIHVFFIFGFLIATIFYYNIIKKIFFKKILIFMVIFYYVVLIIQFLNDSSLFYKINLFESFTFTFVLTLCILVFLYENLAQKAIYFYVVIGSLIYQFGSIILLFSFSLFTDTNIKSGLPIFNCHTILTLIYCSFVFWEWKINFSKFNLDEQD
jgi:hypothetical protein